MFTMKHVLLTTIAAVVLVGCGPPDISIYRAAGLGNIEAVKQHLAAGTDVDAKDNYDYTPLHRAALNGHEEIVELLVAEGAEVNMREIDGRTPLDLAIRHEQPEIADLLRKHGGKSGAAGSIHVAAELGNIEAVKQHLAAGVDVNARYFIGDRTPLDWAVEHDKTELADLLRKHGGKTSAELKAEGK